MSSPPLSIPCTLDDYDLDGFERVAAEFGQSRYGYVVTPNADHLIRLHDDPNFRALYAAASFVLLDSRFLSYLLQFTKRLKVRVCTGSDLTERLFRRTIAPGDRIVLIGGSADQARKLADQFKLKDLRHMNPPMGFARDPELVREVLEFVELQSPFRFCLLGVGAPQQEMLAHQLQVRGVARGLAFCVGAAINFLTGAERRAPRWMQRAGAEWLFRLSQDPMRLAKRYLVRGPRLFFLMRRTGVIIRASHDVQSAGALP